MIKCQPMYATLCQDKIAAQKKSSHRLLNFTIYFFAQIIINGKKDYRSCRK